MAPSCEPGATCTMSSFAKRILPLFVLAVVLIGLPRPAAAQGGAPNEVAPGLRLEARPGFDGYYKSGYWLPVQVTAANAGPPLEGELRVLTGSPLSRDAVLYTAPLSLPTQSNKRVPLVVYLPRITGALTITLADNDGRTVAELPGSRLTELAPADLLYGVVSSEPGAFVFLENVAGGRRQAAVAFLTLDDLPETGVAWSALDVLILDDVDAGRLSSAQRAALEGWIATGGQLVVTGGPNWQKTAVPLADLLPVAISGAVSVDDLPDLQTALGFPLPAAGPYVVADSRLTRGELLLHQDGLPLLARVARGRGAVYFLALDPKLAPLLNWGGREQFWNLIAADAPPTPAWGLGVQNSWAAATAVSSIPTLALPAAWQLVLFLLVYILAIGPLNYLALTRLGRRELAWVTIPALVVLFAGVTYFTGFRLKGSDAVLNQMAVVFGRAGSEQARVESLIGLFTPRRDTYSLTLPADSAARPFDSSSLTSSGGMTAVARASDLTIRDVRADTGSILTFIANSTQPLPAISGEAALRVVGGDVLLEARVQNNSDLTLQDAAVLLGSDIVALGDLPPNSSQSASVRIGAAPGASAAPLFAPGAGTFSPLIRHADTLLGTSDYYNDRAAFPRWQLLQALEVDAFAVPAAAQATDSAILVAWSDAPQLDVRVSSGARFQSTTLYLLELPLNRQTFSGDAISVPLSLLAWEIIADESGGGVRTVENFYLVGGAVAFEFKPQAEFAGLTVKALTLALRHYAEPPPALAPGVQLWDWENAQWTLLPDVGWGETAVTPFAPFIGPQNAVRLRLEDAAGGVEIQAVYPVLTGDMD